MKAGSIVLVPSGPVSGELLAWLAHRLAEVFEAMTSVEEQIPVPEAGYDPGHDQYGGRNSAQVAGGCWWRRLASRVEV